MNVIFYDHLQVEQVADETWVVLADLELQVVPNVKFYNGHITHIIVPKGFITDFASVPRIPLAYLAFGGVGERAAVVHDYLCTTKECDFKTAAEIFYACLLEDKVSWFQRKAMYQAVRWFGPRF